MANQRFAFSTGALNPMDSVDALRMIKEAGFDCAELMPQAISDASEAATLAFEKTGIRLTSIHYPLVMFGVLYNPVRSMIEDGRKFSRDLLTMGKRMGTEVLVVHPHEPIRLKGYYDRLEAPIIENLRYLADLCAEFGITMAMENSPKSCANAPMLKDYITMLDKPAILPMIDTTEACEAGEDPLEFLRQCKPCHLHMSDFDYTGGVKHLPAGEGDLDWKTVRQILDGYGYAGMYTLEPTYRFYLDDTAAKLRSAYCWLEENFSD